MQSKIIQRNLRAKTIGETLLHGTQSPADRLLPAESKNPPQPLLDNTISPQHTLQLPQVHCLFWQSTTVGRPYLAGDANQEVFGQLCRYTHSATSGSSVKSGESCVHWCGVSAPESTRRNGATYLRHVTRKKDKQKEIHQKRGIGKSSAKQLRETREVFLRFFVFVRTFKVLLSCLPCQRYSSYATQSPSVTSICPKIFAPEELSFIKRSRENTPIFACVTRVWLTEFVLFG